MLPKVVCNTGILQGKLLIKAIVKMDVWFEAYLSYNFQGLPGDVFPGL